MSARNVVIAAIVLAAVAGGGAYYLMNEPAETETAATTAPADAGATVETATDEAEIIVDAYAVDDEETLGGEIADDETIDETLGELVEGAEIATEEAIEPGEEFVDVYESAGENFSDGAPPAEEFAEDAETMEETVEEPQQ